MNTQGQRHKNVALVVFVAILLAGMIVPLVSKQANADDFSVRRLGTSDNMAGATNVQYALTFSGQSMGSVGSIRLQLCQNDPFPGTPCTVPIGFDISHAQLVTQTGMTGFSIHSSTTANELVLTRTPSLSIAGQVMFELRDVTNPTNAGSYYARLETFSSTNASGSHRDAGGMAIAILPENLNIQTYVPPYLAFCIGNTIQSEDCSTAEGNYIDFGELSPSRTATGQTKLLIATNADYGYVIRVFGTTLTSGINVIPAITSTDASRPGTSQFGLNLRANATPNSGQNPSGMGRGAPEANYNIPDRFQFVSGDILASYNDPDYYRMYTVDYIVNVDKNQSPGVYVTTLTYIALASF